MALGHPGEFQDNLLVGWFCHGRDRLSEATSKRASSTAAALASSSCYSTVVSCSLTHSCSSSRTAAGRVLSLRSMYERIGFYVTDTVPRVIWAIAAGKVQDEGGRCPVHRSRTPLSEPWHLSWVNSPMRSGTPSTLRYRSDSQLRGLPRSSSGSRFRT